MDRRAARRELAVLARSSNWGPTVPWRGPVEAARVAHFEQQPPEATSAAPAPPQKERLYRLLEQPPGAARSEVDCHCAVRGNRGPGRLSQHPESRRLQERLGDSTPSGFARALRPPHQWQVPLPMRPRRRRTCALRWLALRSAGAEPGSSSALFLWRRSPQGLQSKRRLASAMRPASSQGQHAAQRDGQGSHASDHPRRGG